MPDADPNIQLKAFLGRYMMVVPVLSEHIGPDVKISLNRQFSMKKWGLLGSFVLSGYNFF